MKHKSVGQEIVSSNSGKRFFAKSENQNLVREKFEMNDIICLTGPAGTGKSYISILLAAKLLKAKVIDKIILTRPAVAAGGEELGFLPGEVDNKMDPYLQPMYDILKEVFDEDKKQKARKKKATQGNQSKSNKAKQSGPKTTIDFSEFIEIIPVAFCRGKTFSNCVVIVDEAENLTKGQMHLLLTRIGEGGKMIFNGDLKQSDLKSESGYKYFLNKLNDSPIKGIDQVNFTPSDIIRHKLISEIDALF